MHELCHHAGDVTVVLVQQETLCILRYSNPAVYICRVEDRTHATQKATPCKHAVPLWSLEKLVARDNQKRERERESEREREKEKEHHAYSAAVTPRSLYDAFPRWPVLHHLPAAV
jgi:hypothetical protein